MSDAYRLLILYADGRYAIKSASATKEYPSLFSQKCQTVAILPPRPHNEKYFRNIENVRGYMNESGGRDVLPFSDWVEFLDAIGLIDEKIGCIFGDVILVGSMNGNDCHVPDSLIMIVQAYHAIISQKDSSHRKWAHIKELTIHYAVLKACQWRECDGRDCSQLCKSCKSVMYCSRECQVKDWPIHKIDCHALTDKLVDDNNNCKQQ